MTGQVCCVTVSPPSAMCIQPEQFASLGCMLPPEQQVPCFSPSDCPSGQVCCLNQNGPSINCLSSVMCPGNGQSGTWLACAGATDCLSEPQNLCQAIPGTGDAGQLKYCAPPPPHP
jgi:hypothetical protein